MAMDVRFPADDPAWTMGRPYEVGRRFLYRWNDGDRLLLRGRAMVLLLAAALATTVFLWTRTAWGFPAAALGLLLTVTSPDVLAHGQVVTTDLGAALFIFACVAAFERMTSRVTVPRVLLAGLALGAALATKFSALILLPVLGGAGGRGGAARGADDGGAVGTAAGGWTAGPRSSPRWPSPSRSWPRSRSLCVWAAYGFRFAATPDPAFEASIPWDRLRPEEPALARRGGRDARDPPAARGLPVGLRPLLQAPAGAAGVPARRAFGRRLLELLSRELRGEDARRPARPRRSRGVAGRVTPPAQPGRRLSLDPRGPVRRGVAQPRHQHRPSAPAAAVPVPLRRRRPRGGLGGCGLAAARAGRGRRRSSPRGTWGRRCGSIPTTSRTSTSWPEGPPAAIASWWIRAWTGGRTCAA